MARKPIVFGDIDQWGPILLEWVSTHTNDDGTLIAGQITGSLGYTPVNKAGDTMTGALTLSGAPSSSLHAATKAYVDSVAGAGIGYTPVNKAGDTMTGLLTLSADPSTNLQAATKQYVDSHTVAYTPVNKAGDSMSGNLTLTGTAAVAFGTNPAASGFVRLPNAGWIAGRNQANSADINVIQVNASNQIALGTTTLIPNNIWLLSRNNANSADVNIFRVNTTDQIEIGAETRRSNNVWSKWRNAANSADISAIKVNASDQLEVGVEEKHPNNVWIKGRNAAGTSDINMIRINASDQVELGPGATIGSAVNYLEVGGLGGPSQNDPAFFVWKNYTGNQTGNQSTGYFYAQAKGARDTGHFLYNVLSQIQDVGVTANKTITGATRSGTTLTVTAASHGYANGDRVILDGIVHTFNVQVNGTYTVSNVTGSTFDVTVAGLSSGAYSSGGIATNRPGYSGHLVLVGPTQARGGLGSPNTHADDVNGYFVSNNGTAKATDPFYVGRNASLATEWDTYGSYDGAAANGILMNNIVGGSSAGPCFRGTVYGTGGVPAFVGRTARGTFEAPRRAKSGDTLFRLSSIPFTAADDATNATASSSFSNIAITYVAAEDQTGTAQGGRMEFATTQIGTTSKNIRMKIQEADGIDFVGCTFATYQMRLKNATWITARNAADNANINVFRINATDEIEIGATPAIKVATYVSQLTLANDTYLTARNAANSANLNLIKANASNQLRFGLNIGTAAWSVSNVTTDRTFNANSYTMDEMADAFGTLVLDLQTAGLLP